ncbi:MAG: class I SAM-dependent methyltransferase [Methylococcaceae bacterium]|nr:class I SAM-dependent methyltransferase [Methylococcaceae bacterium]
MKVDSTRPLFVGKLAVLYEGVGEIETARQLADRLAVPLYRSHSPDSPEEFFLSWRDGTLKLIDRELLKQGGLFVDIHPRPGEQRSFPAPKQGSLAQALGRKTKTVIDATTGWAQDSLHIFRMGYDVRCIERSPVMSELLLDGFNRLSQQDWVRRRNLEPPQLLTGNAIDLLLSLDNAPDCIYLDPMFPEKRKKSALAKKSMMVLRGLLGDDEDKEQLFEVAFKTAKKRLVVKSPDYAAPLGGKPNESIQGKLLRYDVYFKE